ncbi:MAG: YcdB/YcdC domain-containing protein [Oscillospiraceae bacterium]
MKKIQKQIISVVMAAAMIFSAVPAGEGIGIAAAAAESGSTAGAEALKKAIIDVKKRIDIPAELDDFAYEIETRYETDYFLLQWYHVDENGGITRYINDECIDNVTKAITVEYYDGLITFYNNFDSDFSASVKPGFAKLSVDEQQKRAEENFKRLNPDLKGTAVFERKANDNGLSSATVSYTIKRTENGIDVDNNEGSMSIDRDTGEVLNMYLTWYADGGEFADASRKISVDEANALYKQRKGLYASYKYFENSEYNPETEQWETERFILPVYRPVNVGENEIDAISGKYTSYYDDREKYSYIESYEWNGCYDEFDLSGSVFSAAGLEEVGMKNEKALTEAELQAIDNESSFISKEKAIELIKKDKYILLNDELVFRSKSIGSYTDENDREHYVLNISFSYTPNSDKDIYLDVKMDAYTGDIIAYNKSYLNYYDGQPVDIKTAEKAAEAAMKQYLGGLAEQYKLIHKEYDKQPDEYVHVEFVREVNGLETDFDYVDIKVDFNGEVTGFNYSYHDMDFPEPELVSEDTAYEMLFENMAPQLKYTGFTDKQMRSHTYLTYIYDSSFVLNALTGERINFFSGKAYYTDEAPAEEKPMTYSDINGYKYEKEISTLLAYGICIRTENGRLAPDENITVGEFYDLTGELFGVSLPYFESEEELNAYRSKTLTYAELAKLYVLNYTGCGEAAEIKGIYRSPFPDIPETHAYCGYIAIAKAQGMADGNDGKFSPNKGISKGRCLKLLYDYIAQDEDMKLYEIYKI